MARRPFDRWDWAFLSLILGSVAGCGALLALSFLGA